MTSEQLEAIVVSCATALDQADEMNSDPVVGALLTSAQASLAAIALFAQDINEAHGLQKAEADDDPANCGHPDTFDLPGQTMCESCGASHNADGTWSIW